ncbi:MAG: potassium-transporting ATPase subunit KdpC [Methanoregulaceae archaeon]|nr:potassium-transporting ATPase subunit KdpC [Methanoregulaceae archaeon]
MKLPGPLRTAALLFLVLFLVSGVIYPVLVTGIGELAFPAQAHGSLVRDKNGTVIGSMLIGQDFAGPFYFQGRPSATQGSPYNAGQSGGSNLGPSNPVLAERVNQTLGSLGRQGISGPWPGDLVTASASGLDPHITLEAALAQVPSVASARGMNEEEVRALVLSEVTRSPFLFHPPYVNVLTLNRALDGEQ